MSSGSSLNELLQQKRVRLVLAVVCTWFALRGAYQLLDGPTQVDWLRGGGNVLVWGGFAVLNGLKAFGRTLAGINIPINVGIVLIVAAWVVHL
jgi:hypothetical protein